MSPQLIRKIAWLNLQLSVFALIIIIIIIMMRADAETYIQVGDSAGLPYTETRQMDIFLKEAYILIQTLSTWERQTAGFEPHHAVEMNMNAKYVFQNDVDEEVDLSIRLPLMVSLEERSLSFALNSRVINYTGVEYANPREAGTGLLLYTLDLRIPPGKSVMMVNGTSTGVAGREVDVTVLMMKDASTTWPKPMERLVVSSMHENGMITGYSIQPSRTTLKAATWEFDEVPGRDLMLQWQITESPVASGLDGAKVRTSDPLIPPVIALAVGGAIIGYIAYIRLKRRRTAEGQRNQISKSWSCLSSSSDRSL